MNNFVRYLYVLNESWHICRGQARHVQRNRWKEREWC